MPTATPVLVSYEESLLRPESSLEEVVNGELHTMPPPAAKHNRILQRVLRSLYAEMDAALDFAWDVGFLIAEEPRLRYRIPDLAIADRRLLDLLAQEGAVYARFPPAVVIEVLSPANRKGDMAQLLQDYRDLRVREIVFIDPDKRVVSIDGIVVTGERFTIGGVVIEMKQLFVS